MKFIVDIGNSYVKCYIFDRHEIVEKAVAEDLFDDKIASLIAQYDIKGAIIASTRGEKIELPSQIAELKNLILFDSKTPIPIQNLYKSDTLGMDRLAGAVSACQIAEGKEAVIFDCGTALTIDFVADNKFLGGNISPGLMMRFKALNAFTGALPLCSPSDELISLATTTKDAIINGVITSMLHEIERYIEKNCQKVIIFTGGDAKYFVKHIKIPIFADYELVPKGLNRILLYNEDSK